jgi:hypothetical protein
MPNYLEYNRPIPYSLNNSERVGAGVVSDGRRFIGRKPQKRKGHLAIVVLNNEGEVKRAKRISKSKACVHLGLWNRPKVINHKPVR